MSMVSLADWTVQLIHKQVYPTGLQLVTLTDCSTKILLAAWPTLPADAYLTR